MQISSLPFLVSLLPPFRQHGIRAFLVGLALFVAAPQTVTAQTCTPSGEGTLPRLTFSDASYPEGIRCPGMRGGLTLIVAPPDGGTTITGTGERHGIEIKDTNRALGVISVDVRAGTKIGTEGNPVGQNGIVIEIQGSPDLANTEKISIVNAGSIRVRRTGINVSRSSNGDITVTNSGTIVSDSQEDSVKEGGIIVRARKKGHVVINHSGSVTSGWHAAIYGWYEGEAAEGEGSVTITSSGVVRSMVKHGVLAHVTKPDAAIPATVTVTGGTVHGTDDGIRAANHGKGSATVRVTGNARIESDNEDGIHASTGTETNHKSEAAVRVDLGNGSTVVTQGKNVEDGESSHGIYAEHWGNQAMEGEKINTGTITINSAGTIRTAAGTHPSHGIAAFAHGTDATVPITLNVGDGSITAAGTGVRVENKGKGNTTIVVGNARIESDSEDGIHTSTGTETNQKSEAVVRIDLGKGSTIVTQGKNVEDGESSHGIYAEHWGNQAMEGEKINTGTITIDSAGTIRTAAAGTHPSHGIAAFAHGTNATVPITLNVGDGSVTAAGAGVHLENKGKGKSIVVVGEDSSITAGKDGIYVDGARIENGMRAQTVTVRGKVMGGGEGYASVRMIGGGTIVIGPMAHVSAKSGVLIEVDDHDGDTLVVLEKDVDGFVSYLDGRILSRSTDASETTIFKIRPTAGTEDTPLNVGDRVNIRGEKTGLYQVLKQAELKTITGGFQFEEVAANRIYEDRARVFEAVPSVLLNLTQLPTYNTRKSSPRVTIASLAGNPGWTAPAHYLYPSSQSDVGSTAGGVMLASNSHVAMVDDDQGNSTEALNSGKGVWARIDVSEGKRRANDSTTGKGFHGHSLEWEQKNWGITAGYDFPLNNAVEMGVSVHHRRGNASVSKGGNVESTGTGLGLSMTYTGESGWYVDNQLAYTRLGDIKIHSNSDGIVTSNLSGSSFAVGVEAGKRIALETMTLTPRGGFTWASVAMDSFDDLGNSGRVSLASARSFKGRIGVLAEREGDGAGRLHASLDLEHEFSPTRGVTAPGAELTSSEKSTWGRLGLGGSVPMGATLLAGEAFYATAGGGNMDYGAELSLGYRF